MNNPKKITAEFVRNYIKSGYRIFVKDVGPKGCVLIQCDHVWPWYYNGRARPRLYRFDKKSHSVEVMGSHFIKKRYLSRKSEEYRGVMAFITEMVLQGKEEFK